MAIAEIDIIFDLENQTSKTSGEIEAIYFYTGDGWSFTQSGEECPSSSNPAKKPKLKHFIKPPMPRFSPGAWTQVKIKGEKTLWTRWSGSELEDSYRLAGSSVFEIVTSQEIFSTQIPVDVSVNDIPF